MKLSDITFYLDHSYPELETLLPIVNAMTRNGYTVKANFRLSHYDKQYYFRLNLYQKGLLYPLVALRFFLKKDFDPNDDVYADFCDANFDKFSLYFSTNKGFCTELKVSVYEQDTLPVDVILTPGYNKFQTSEIVTYLVCFEDSSLCFDLFSPILNKIINSDGGIITSQLKAHGNNKRANLRLYFDYEDNSFAKSPIRISGILSDRIPFDPGFLSNITLYSQQNYPIKLEIETFGGNSGPLLRFRVFEK